MASSAVMLGVSGEEGRAGGASAKSGLESLMMRSSNASHCPSWVYRPTSIAPMLTVSEDGTKQEVMDIVLVRGHIKDASITLVPFIITEGQLYKEETESCV